jgi:TRAP-type C4-dicarboxylate transport system substrate-binding protein
MTGHMWDGQWVLANGKMWASLPPDLQAIVARNISEAVVKQRDDMAKLNETLEADLKSKGLIFNSPDKNLFRAALTKAGFYEEWKTKFGPEAWAKLEQYSGKLA